MKKTPTAKIVNRCDWCGDDSLYQKYHDEEWGAPTFDDKTLFEFLILEGAQAGLSWITVLRKRENYRKAFHQFNPEKIARYSENKIQRLKLDAGIIRNDLKIRSAVSNAQCYIELCNEKDSLSNYLWNFVEGKPIKNHWQSMKTLPANTPLSDTISKDLKKRGFKFVGSTIIYAYMQSMGLVNDHLTSCHCYDN